MTRQPDTLTYFRLKPIQSARVSEISETTAAVELPDEERVNFHIGNPLQDERLSSAFLLAALGADANVNLDNAEPEAILDHLRWEADDQQKIELINQMIQRSIPYMPRGGYNRKAPHRLIKAFSAWLENQQEPLRYDTGEQSGRREMILASGGIQETLRVLFFAIASYLEITPARILCFQSQILPQQKSIPHLIFEDLDADEHTAYEQIERYLSAQPEIPTFLLLGSVLGEEARRKLRRLSVERPLFFIEVNNAPNHLSLAREAKLIDRVLRLLTPTIFAPRLHALSTVFVAGNAEFLNVIENVHFNLKGTPSAAEVELLSHLLEHRLPELSTASPTPSQTRFSSERAASGEGTQHILPRLAEQMEVHLQELRNHHAQRLTHSVSTLEEKIEVASQYIQRFWKANLFDEFFSIPTNDLLELLVQNIDQPTWFQALQRSFISAFIQHQPQYKPEACLVASGSSRTALGILGFHCGIGEVVIPDMSWSYEQCFPKVHAVPLTATLNLDVEAMIQKVTELCQADASWQQRGAVVINSPHNATGRIFAEAEIRQLIAYCLKQNLYVIDDLAYQNVAPVDDLPEIKTVRQIASEFVWNGVLSEEQANRVITVHSLSKTDCLAGARLAIVEIRDQELLQRFEEVNRSIQPNIGAILIGYLFYRRDPQVVRAYWHLRNAIFQERTQALLKAAANLPQERNPFGLTILPPMGSMYPLLQVKHLPDGLSLDWLSSSLARQGIGLLPLATFARTEEGFETGRTSFRLTLGGADGAETLLAKTRRLLIDLNRLIAEEQAKYNRKSLRLRTSPHQDSSANQLVKAWDEISRQILQCFEKSLSLRRWMSLPPLDEKKLRNEFLHQYVPERLRVFQIRLLDRGLISEALMQKALSDSSEWLAERLEREFMKDSLGRRQESFRLRSYDRTVHPTQMYSLSAEIALDAIVSALISQQPIAPALIEKSAHELLGEYIGKNVAISSAQEGDEILLDLDTLIASEEYAGLFTDAQLPVFLSFWSDWDGSNRPSGQGHRLVGSIVMENVHRMAGIFALLRQAAPNVAVDPEVVSEIERLPQRSQRFLQLLNAITQLTHQLEQRYQGILTFTAEATPWQRLASRWHLRRVPARTLWEHNDRYERRMLELRRQRRVMLEEYFALNKKLRKQLYALIPEILKHRSSKRLLHEVIGYRDLLQRVVITPRIHQGLITMRDQFAIDTTAYNICEINTIAGRYGNPGMTLALQVSLATKPEALISLDRKLRTQAERMRREHPSVDLPPIWIIPLFEDMEAVSNIRNFLDRVWDYANQSRQTSQTPQDRFSEIIAEVFIAGSDLSQQVCQATAAFLYRKAKYDLQIWLAEHGVAESVRVKLGSGETMQRQGGYYSHVAGQLAFSRSDDSQRRYAAHLPAGARKSTAYAVTPLQGVFLGGDLRTFQSNLSEQLRYLPAHDTANLLYHVRKTQQDHRNDLIRAAETMVESRLETKSRSAQELVRLTIGMEDAIYASFLEELTENFRHILYGREEDVIGIHIVSYFIGRSLPQWRDRPVSRQIFATGNDRRAKQAISIAEMIPLAKQGSLMRAIAHHQAQTVVLGINQLSTGLFRALERFAQKTFTPAEQERMVAERILPHLPVYEILTALRLYQDWQGEFLRQIESAFPAGNSAFVALREDSDAMRRYLPLFQQELLRRHGVNVNNFFNEGGFLAELLPTLRPDLAVLLQQNLFNTSLDLMLEEVSGRLSDRWRAEVMRLLQTPRQISFWRSRIWDVIGDSVYQRVHSFAELATGLYAFSTSRSFGMPPGTSRAGKISPVLADFFRATRIDDEMRAFLLSAIEYLSSFAEENIEVPVSVLRALNDVERIAQIEKNPLPEAKRDLIRCSMLQIARLAGENG